MKAFVRRFIGAFELDVQLVPHHLLPDFLTPHRSSPNRHGQAGFFGVVEPVQK